MSDRRIEYFLVKGTKKLRLMVFDGPAKPPGGLIAEVRIDVKALFDARWRKETEATEDLEAEALMRRIAAEIVKEVRV